MAGILETLGNNEQLGKVFFELLEQIATSAALKANENERRSKNDQTLPLCKSVPISPSDEVQSVQIISVDCRNHGKSPRSNLMTYSLMASDVAKTLKQLGISKAILIGHSLGSRVAMELALSMPDSIEKLVLVDLPPMATPNPFLGVILSAVANLDLTLVKTSNDADDMLSEAIPIDFIRAYVLKCLYEDEEGRFHWGTDIKNVQKNTDALFDGKQASIQLNGRAPYTSETLFIAGGESDDLKNADMNEIRKLFPKAELRVIAGATHFVHTDKPEEFVEIVRNFLE